MPLPFRGFMAKRRGVSEASRHTLTILILDGLGTKKAEIGSSGTQECFLSHHGVASRLLPFDVG